MQFQFCLFIYTATNTLLLTRDVWASFKNKDHPRALEEPLPLPTELLSTIPFMKRSHVSQHDVEVVVRFWLTGLQFSTYQSDP